MNPGGRGMYGFSMRSFRRDESVTDVKLAPGTLRRIADFAAPYRWVLAVFMVLVIVDAVIGVVNPLILREIIDQGILHKEIGLIEGLAFLVAGLAILDAALGLAERWVSAIVGEGLIFDMRARVFAHVQSMPIAFFTRTQTGALVTRLNNDVLGAQQAFTDILSSVISNFVSVVLVLAAMLFLSWKITLVGARAASRVRGARAADRSQAGRHREGELRAQRRDEHHHDRALQRRGRTPREALRPSRDRESRIRQRGQAGCATSG